MKVKFMGVCEFNEGHKLGNSREFNYRILKWHIGTFSFRDHTH